MDPAIKAILARSEEIKATQRASALEHEAVGDSRASAAPFQRASKRKAEDPGGAGRIARTTRVSASAADATLPILSPSAGVPESPALANISPSNAHGEVLYSHGHVSNYVFAPGGRFYDLFKSQLCNSSQLMRAALLSFGMTVPTGTTQPALRFYLSVVTGELDDILVDVSAGTVVPTGFKPAAPLFVRRRRSPSERRRACGARHSAAGPFVAAARGQVALLRGRSVPGRDGLAERGGRMACRR